MRWCLVGVLALVSSVALVSRGVADVRQVTRVIDGDTLVLDGGERVRLIGVDTPETVHRPITTQR